jgi:pSer/pThr/pTyr-binding forkhead associated (FHA) protein
LLCSSSRSIGLLCTAHGVAIASPGVTSEQISSRARAAPHVDRAPPRAAVIDAWGIAHAVAEGAKVGRDPNVDLAVLHASVSSEHATFARDGDRWTITDHSSRNGTEVDGARVTTAELPRGAVVRLGDVRLYFWPEPLPHLEPPRGAGRTAPTQREALAFGATVTTPRGHVLELRRRPDGGILRAGDSTIELAAMEFGLLQVLIERRRATTDRELAYVAWHEIADALSFRSVQADSENVRELVHRVRRKLATVKADDIIESKRGVGYRLAGDPA